MARLSDVFLKKNRVNDVSAWKTIRKGVRFHLRPTSYQPYIDATTNIDHLPKDERERRYTEAMAKHLLIEWEGLDDDDGSAMESNLPNKIALISEYAEVAWMILEFCSDIGNFVGSQEVDQELGN